MAGLHAGQRYLRDDDWVVVDGRHGTVIVNPDEKALKYYKARQRDIARHHAERRKLRKAPVVTLDGERIRLMANVEPKCCS